MDKVIKISVKEVMDYCFCPMLYELEKNKKKTLADIYRESLRGCVFHYLNRLKAENRAGIESLMGDWGRKWIRENKPSSMIAGIAMSTSRYEDYRRSGIESLMAFHKICLKTEQYPILVNKGWETMVSKNVCLTGSFDVLRSIYEDSRDVVQIVFIDTDGRGVTQKHGHNYKMTADMYAFMKMFTNVGEPESVYINLPKNREWRTHITSDDIKQFRKTTMHTAKCIQAGIKTISPDARCSVCRRYKDCPL